LAYLSALQTISPTALLPSKLSNLPGPASGVPMFCPKAHWRLYASICSETNTGAIEAPRLRCSASQPAFLHRAVCTPTKEPADGAGGSAHRKSPDPHGPGPSGRGLLKAPAQAGLPYDRPRPRSIWGTE